MNASRTLFAVAGAVLISATLGHSKEPKRTNAESHAAANRQTTTAGAGNREKVVSDFTSALMEKSIDRRLKKYLTLLETLDADHAPAIYELLERRGREGRDVSFELAALSRRWGAIDPKGALKFLDGRPEGEKTKYIYNLVSTGWAMEDPAAAMAWVNAHWDHPQFEAALQGAMSGYAQKDLKGATKSAIDIIGPDPRLMPKVLEGLVAAASNESIDTLKARYGQLPADPAWGPLKSSAALQVYALLPKEDYAENARWVGALTGSNFNNGVITRFARDYAEADPEKAMNWVQTTTPKPDNKIIIGVGEIVQTWSQKDMDGLGRWLDANRTSPVFNQATRDLAVFYADTNRELAKYWGEQNTDPARRAFIDKLLSKPPKPTTPPAKSR